jgi:hypothetical protein
VTDAYIVITFDSVGALTPEQAAAKLDSIAAVYSRQIYEAPVVQLMSDLVPGKPLVNHAERVMSVLTEMAYTPENKRLLWLYMRCNASGMISLYCYSRELTYQTNKPIFDAIINSLSFEDLQEAGRQNLVFTEVKGGDGSPAATPMAGGSSGRGTTVIIIGVAVAAAVVLVVMLVRRKSKAGGWS